MQTVQWNKTKIICTIGPATDRPPLWEELIEAGMDVARFNFSHGDPAGLARQMHRLRAVSRRLKTPLALLQDLPGPKIRIGDLKQEYIDLEPGHDFFLTVKKIAGDTSGVTLDNPLVLRSLRKNHRIYLNDGLIKLRVKTVRDGFVGCEVVAGGRVYPRKGVTCPEKLVSLSAVTAYDLRCIDYGVDAGVDFVAVSFVEHPDDIEKVKKYLKKKGSRAGVIAKIERSIAFEHLDQIIAASDAVMVARGDMGAEMDPADVPFLQKDIIQRCNSRCTPVITATQMMVSMVNQPQPTRAEAADIANAILDGTDALMLSEETAVGKYPVQAVNAMRLIAAAAEKQLPRHFRPDTGSLFADSNRIDFALSENAASLSDAIGAKLICVPTDKAPAAAWISGCRPRSSILGITADPHTYQQLILYWGIFPVLIRRGTIRRMMHQSIEFARSRKLVQKADLLVIVVPRHNGLDCPSGIEIQEV